ncbi:MAG: flagellar hook-length control protein FliK [Gammaproteobacteria bacterium]|nr:flagellar hook-length control protein FliK [Gammaproteobacteria bacterium]
MMVSIEAIFPAMLAGVEKTLQPVEPGDFQSVLDQLLPPQPGNEGLQILPASLQNLPVSAESTAKPVLPVLPLQQPANLSPAIPRDIARLGVAGLEPATGATLPINTAARLIGVNTAPGLEMKTVTTDLVADVPDVNSEELLTTVNKLMEQSRPMVAQEAATAAASTYSMTSMTGIRNDNAPASTSGPSIMDAELAMNEPAWESGMEHRLKWMISQRIQQAEIRLSPRELGAIDVSISMDGDAVRIHFNTASPAAKELVEGSLLRLQDALESDGLSLGHCSVGSGDSRSRSGFSAMTETAMTADNEPGDHDQGTESTVHTVISSSGLLNVFA